MPATCRPATSGPREAVVEAFGPEIEEALENPVDFKSALQELLARRGAEVSYEVAAEEGPPHERIYEVLAVVDGRDLGRGERAQQEAGRAGGRADRGREAGQRVSRSREHLPCA